MLSSGTMSPLGSEVRPSSSPNLRSWKANGGGRNPSVVRVNERINKSMSTSNILDKVNNTFRLTLLTILRESEIVFESVKLTRSGEKEEFKVRWTEPV